MTATEARRGLILLPIKCSCSAHAYNRGSIPTPDPRFAGDRRGSIPTAIPDLPGIGGPPPPPSPICRGSGIIPILVPIGGSVPCSETGGGSNRRGRNGAPFAVPFDGFELEATAAGAVRRRDRPCSGQVGQVHITALVRLVRSGLVFLPTWFVQYTEYELVRYEQAEIFAGTSTVLPVSRRWRAPRGSYFRKTRSHSTWSEASRAWSPSKSRAFERYSSLPTLHYCRHFVAAPLPVFI